MLIQYVGFNLAPSSRIYNFDVLSTAEEVREFTVAVHFESFRPALLKLQDGPGICFARLKQALDGETDESRATPCLSIRERDVQEYMEQHYPPKKTFVKKTAASLDSAASPMSNQRRQMPEWKP
ncbi:MAG: hypothetical protein ACRD2O_16110 [Terriglobia bacterium]